MVPGLMLMTPLEVLIQKLGTVGFLMKGTTSSFTKVTLSPTVTWGQCYKTFFVHNLRIFVISPWQAFST
jgi:hypothetical protein